MSTLSTPSSVNSPINSGKNPISRAWAAVAPFFDLRKESRLPSREQITLSKDEFYALARSERVALLEQVSKPLVITVDGTAASGKSSRAETLVAEYGLKHLIDSGRYFRAFGFAANSLNLIDFSERNPNGGFGMIASVEARAKLNDIIKNGRVLFPVERPAGLRPIQRVFFEMKGSRASPIELTNMLDTEDVARAASVLGRIPEVRQRIVELQKEFEHGSLVSVGRNQALEVYPPSDTRFHIIRIFIDAPLEERAERRFHQLDASKKAGNESVETMIKRLKERDDADRSPEKHFPLLTMEQIQNGYGLLIEPFCPVKGTSRQEAVEDILDFLDERIWTLYSDAVNSKRA